jgi:hypothetical protein
MEKKGILNRLKKKITTDSDPSEKKTTADPSTPSQQYQDEPLAEYEETLYASDSNNVVKQEPVSSNLRSQPMYRDVNKIEEDIDTLSKEKKIELPNDPIDDNISSKVDRVLSQAPIKRSNIVHKKPANVIYVVSKPQPGQVKGDWAVRSHGKIFSHHRTKEVAIKKAREIARERDATVLIQRMDGTFSEGFKPRKKSE